MLEWAHTASPIGPQSDREHRLAIDQTCSWGVLLSQHQRHKLVESGLTDAGVGYYLPFAIETKIISGRHVRTKRPLLGRYIFFIITDIWKTLAHLRGVSGMLMDAEKTFPAKVDSKALESFRSFCALPKDNVAVRKGFVYGQRVAPQTGPLAYHVGSYDGPASRHREAAVFNLFGREQRVVFKSGDLIAA